MNNNKLTPIMPPEFITEFNKNGERVAKELERTEKAVKSLFSPINKFLLTQDVSSVLNKEMDNFKEELIEVVKNIENENKELKKENRYLNDEHFKDIELKTLKDKIEELEKQLKNRYLYIDRKDDEKIKNWMNTHNEGKCGNRGYGAIDYHICDTHIITAYEVICPFCGEKFEFKEW